MYIEVNLENMGQHAFRDLLLTRFTSLWPCR